MPLREAEMRSEYLCGTLCFLPYLCRLSRCSCRLLLLHARSSRRTGSGRSSRRLRGRTAGARMLHADGDVCLEAGGCDSVPALRSTGARAGCCGRCVVVLTAPSMGGDHRDDRGVVDLLKKERARRIHEQNLLRERLFLSMDEDSVDLRRAVHQC